jgi:hypothetical protein
VLVEEAALEHAEQQCWPMLINALHSAKERRFYREKQDQALATRMAESIRQIFPRCPPEEARMIAAHTFIRPSGLG